MQRLLSEIKKLISLAIILGGYASKGSLQEKKKKKIM